MSPAGYWPQLYAAIEAGADSVYFGLKHFSARAKVGFSLAELPDVMRTLHRRGVKGFVTFNTLVFEHELREAASALAAIAEAGADAVIVQDLAVLRILREVAPGLEVHASTQMSVTSADGVKLAQELGAKRVTLARELSLAEVNKIREATGCDLEIFVHGALCVAYSGQCFSSEAWGGRSANRGQCAQACRLPYELIVDGRLKPLGDARYLLSPGDLYTLRQVPEIVAAGVAALKIEGRYKDAEYVALTTDAYRRAVDDAWEKKPMRVDRAGELRLEQAYSRGLGAYFLTGTNHQTVVNGRAPRHRGVRMGRVARVLPGAVLIEPSEANAVAPLKPGDGIVFDAADWRSPEEREEGGRIFELCGRSGGRVELRFGNGAIDGARIRPGDLVWRTDDADTAKAARPFTEAAAPVKRQKLGVKVIACEGRPMRAEWWLLERPDVRVVVSLPAILERAQNRGVSEEQLRDQFGRLGGTPYELRQLELEISGVPFAPVSILNQIRREAVEQLARLQEATYAGVVCRDIEQIFDIATPPLPEDAPPVLHLLVRTPEQLDAAMDLCPGSITLDYLDLYGLKPSVERIKSAGIPVRVASPRVLKPGEERIIDFLLRLDCGILVRPAGLLRALRDKPHPMLTGDFSLNAANTIASRELLAMGLHRITPTYDLNAAQITALAQAVGAESIEVLAYGHLPVFHTEHCVFCRFLSAGTSYLDCGRPCEKHRVGVRDAGGRTHPVMADVGCRNTVFGAEAQEASAHLDEWRGKGIRHFRLEFVHESAEEVRRIARAFERALHGETSSKELARELAETSPEGITEGSLFVPRDYMTLPILQ